MSTLERDRVSARRGSGILLPLTRQGDVVAFAIAGVVVVVAFGLALSRTGTVLDAELGVDRWFAGLRVPPVTTIALAIDWLFGPPRAVIIGLLASLAVLWRARRWQPALTFAALIAAGWLATALLKLVVQRPRPETAGLGDPYLPLPGDFSYPSGHTAFAAALAVAVILSARGTHWFRLALVLGAAGSVVVALSRVLLGVHFPSDTLASLLLTPSVCLLVLAVLHRTGLQDAPARQDR